MSSSFVIPDDIKMRYAGLYLLKEMLEGNFQFPQKTESEEGEEPFAVLPAEYEALEPIFLWLLEVGYVFIDEQEEYAISEDGLAVISYFLERDGAFLNEYDIFCGVDLEQRDFALRYFKQFEDGAEWQTFLSDKKWEDLRIAIAEYKGLDAIEIVFMSFINEQRFGRDAEGWKKELLLGFIWDEIQMICNNAIRLESLEEKRGGVLVSGELVLQELLDEGAQVLEELSAEA
ncbi:MAG: hypothetical protein KA436_04790 [Oligoflexales bacterium]|nr:hypothetical protein [Oligoflexales bacterium]